MSKRAKNASVVGAFMFVLILFIIFAVLIILRDARENSTEEETTNESRIVLDEWWA